MSQFSIARKHMVDSQIHTAGVIDPRILEAFTSLQRERFVPENLSKVACTDENLPLGEGRFLMEPVVHARMIEVAEPKSTDIVLDVGGATGYSAAILAPMVSTVIALEETNNFLDYATWIWNELGIRNIQAFQGKLPDGNPASGPYDIIFINGAVSEIPQKLIDQLAPSGRLIAVLKKAGNVLGETTIVQKTAGGNFSARGLFEAGLPYLPGFEPKPVFKF